MQLWEFLVEQTCDPCNRDVVVWEGPDGEFGILNGREIARRWGEKTGNPYMTYDKMSRTMRYYYAKNILTKIKGRNYAYKFNFTEIARRYGRYPLPVAKKLFRGRNISNSQSNYPQQSRASDPLPMVDPYMNSNGSPCCTCSRPTVICTVVSAEVGE